nr:type-F conjugative transfer system pilin assembly protein TrbC [Salmonella enterica]
MFCRSRLRYVAPPVTGGNAMKRVLISLALLLACGAGMASDHTENRQFIHDQLQMDRQRFRALQTPEFLQRQWSAGAENQAFLDAQASQLRQSMQPGERPVDAALVFVSFSMPPDELKQRVKDAAELNIPVVIRGMVNGDMRATANAVAGLVKESNTGGVQIDPTTFRKYNITAVPVLIVACGNQGDTVDRLQGDLTLHQALKRVAEVGDCADTARNLLRGEVQ